MYYTDGQLQFEVRVEKPNPLFAKMLQQGIGGNEGEIRVYMQYFFQAWALPAKLDKYRDLLLQTATEEIGHIEMLATAVALNLEGAPLSLQQDAYDGNGMVAAVMGGMMPRHILSSGLHAMPVDSNGVPWTGGYVVASGNLAGDMYSNVMAEQTGRTLATRLFEMTDDPGMKNMLSYMIARDTMHQNQWLAVIEELGEHLPVPASFDQSQENQQYSYAFMATGVNGMATPEGRWSSGKSVDGKGEFSVTQQPGAGKPNLASPDRRTYDDVNKPAATVGDLLNKMKP
jgi:Mn-containing catalase